MVFSLPLSGCIDDDVAQESYYTFTGEMVTDYLENREETFSDFIEVLQRAELWDLLSTYGTFTCFAPTNDAIKDFLQRRQYASVAAMPKAECDTLAWMHLLKVAYFTTDLGDGSLPTTNMNNRYLTLTCDGDAETSENVVYHINNAVMIARDDSVENGVVHVVDQVITSSSTLIGEMVCADPHLSLFGQALQMTHLADSLVKTEDENYVIGDDSTYVNSKHMYVFGNNNVYWRYPKKRELKYTIFAEPDEVYEAAGITTIEQLVEYAKSVYNTTYPEDKEDDTIQKDFTNRKNPLNRFVAYHILDRYASYSELTISEGGNWSGTRTQFLTDKQDIMEFYETMCPYTILQVCDAAGQKYINRRGIGTAASVIGSRIYTPTESSAYYDGYTDSRNGIYYYIDRILDYNVDKTINQVLNIRMRFDATTLSPDFMSAGARNMSINSDDKQSVSNIGHIMMGFKPGFTKNFIFSDDTFYGVHCRFWNLSYEADMCACLNNFDIKFKLPPVPAGQTYEVRLGYQGNPARTVVQVYFDDNLTGDIPCGIPVDLRYGAAHYGAETDANLVEDELIEANDKAMRNQGFMKGPGAFTSPANEPMRDIDNCLRRILTTKYFEPGHDYYLRLRQVLDNNAEMSLDYIEIVPKSVYNGKTPEDRW